MTQQEAAKVHTPAAAPAASRNRTLNRLKDKQIRAALPGLHPDGGGLYLQVQKPKAGRPDAPRSWLFLYTSPLTHKRVEMGLGSVGDVSLASAREEAAKARALLKRGLDPRRARDQERELAAAEAAKPLPQTFGEFAEDWMDTNLSQHKNAKHRAQWRSTITNYAGPLLDKTPADITTDDVLRVLRPIWVTVPETAKRVQGRLEKLLDAAGAQGLRDKDRENPARWLGHLKLLLPARAKGSKQHHPALPYENAPALMAELRKREGVAARALEYAILTAARSGEVRGMTWAELNAERTVWTVPASRMKAKVEHRVPLSDRARAILADMDMLRDGNQQDTALVFPGQSGGRSKSEKPLLSDMTLTAVLRRMREGNDDEAEERRKLLRDKYGNDVVVHGFRSTFRDWAEDKAGYEARVVEHALAHTIKNAAERAYRHGDAFDKRVPLMAAWESYLDTGTVRSAAEIIPLKRA